jgi:hypothetical protein
MTPAQQDKLPHRLRETAEAVMAHQWTNTREAIQALTDLVDAAHAAIDVDIVAHRLAEAYVVSDIESACTRTPDEQRRWWWDTRVMLDPREQPDDVLEMNRQALDYAAERGLITRHPDKPHMVRITPRRPFP